MGQKELVAGLQGLLAITARQRGQVRISHLNVPSTFPDGITEAKSFCASHGLALAEDGNDLVVTPRLH